MSVNLKQMDAYVSGSTVVFDESSQAVPTKDLASVDSETSPDTILGVKSGVVAQFALSDVLPGLKIVKKGGNGYLAANSTLNFALVGNSTNGVKVVMLMFGSSDNTMQVVLLNTTTSATLTQLRLTDGTNPVAVTTVSTESHTAHCSLTTGGTSAYIFFLVFVGEVEIE